MAHGRVLILEDRYEGGFSGGTWLGVIDADRRHLDTSRGTFVVDDGPSGGDTVAEQFWNNPPEWIVAGQSPKHVLELIAKLGVTHRHGP